MPVPVAVATGRPAALLESGRGCRTDLSEHVHDAVRRERDVVAARARSAACAIRTAARARRPGRRDVAETARLLRQIDEMLGDAPQLSLDAHGELRGQKLQEIAIDLLRQKRGAGVAGALPRVVRAPARATASRVAGKDPLSHVPDAGRAGARRSSRCGRAPGCTASAPPRAARPAGAVRPTWYHRCS